MPRQLNLIDGTIIVVYCVVVLFFGSIISRKQKCTAHDYFQAGSKLPWFIVGASFVATGMNTEQMVGLVGQAYQYGLVLANWDWLFFPIYTMLI